MSNILGMEQQQAIQALKAKGWSDRRISRELDLHRATVRRYTISKCTIPQTGSAGRASQCEAFREQIIGWLEQGLSVERIHQDLRLGSSFSGSYHSVYRFVRGLDSTSLARVHRLECEPGQEAQIDYGTVSLPLGEGGRPRKVHVLVVTLSFSRKCYVEATLRQNSESFLRCLENAFRYFGGVPQRLCPDNLAAAVKKADWYEPEINPKLRSFAEHYGTLIMPARPRRPTDKGKVEAGVKYVKNNALKGKKLTSLYAVNEHLRWWLENVADKRIHGTTKRQVQPHFLEAEKPALRPLPDGLFPSFSEGRRSVHRDSYIEVAGAYYEVPVQFVGRSLWVRWDAAMVRVFDLHLSPVCSHCRLERGRFSNPLGAGGSRGSVEQSINYYRGRAGRFGEHVLQWADGVIARHGQSALRRLQGLLSLRRKYSPGQINEAARKACLHGHYSLRELRGLLSSNTEQTSFEFLQQHELIRSTQTYDQVASTGDLFD